MKEHLEWPQFGTSENERRLIKKIETLQQRCEELERKFMDARDALHKRRALYMEQQEHIAALKAAQEKIREKIGQLSDFPSRDALLRLVREIQTLTSSEGAGGCGYCQGTGKVASDEDPANPWPCPKCSPTHSPTSAGEDREDG